MTDDTKVPEAPVVETPKAPEGESFLDNRRAEIEKLVITQNETFPEPEVVSDVPATPEAPKEELKPEVDATERIKNAVQKRIDKVIAQKKSVEERLAEAEAELERLKSTPALPETPVQPAAKDDAPPTPEQVEAYIAKMSEEGNHKEVAAATRYLIRLEKELAIKEVEEKQNQTQKQADETKARQLADWTALQRDYISYDDAGKPDTKSDLTLANENGILYKTALALFNDKELHADHYNDPNVIQGFRRAVADAYREIHQQGLLKNTPKGDVALPRSPRMALADPSAEVIEDSPAPTSNALSSAEKVRAELLARKKNRYAR